MALGTTCCIGATIDASTQLHITCTPGTGYGIAIDGGLSGATDPEQRLLRSGANTVTYGLYSDAQRHTPWGALPGEVVTTNGTGTEQQRAVYGRIPPQAAVPGAYSDTVVVTINY